MKGENVVAKKSNPKAISKKIEERFYIGKVDEVLKLKLKIG